MSDKKVVWVETTIRFPVLFNASAEDDYIQFAVEENSCLTSGEVGSAFQDLCEALERTSCVGCCLSTDEQKIVPEPQHGAWLVNVLKKARENDE